MKIYTKTGDGGETGVLGGLRIGKDHDLIAACGDVDETNSWIGLARSCWDQSQLPEVDEVLSAVQQQLFALGCQIANSLSGKPDKTGIDVGAIEWLEQRIDFFTATLPPLREFILPGGAAGAAGLHVARSVCRRAERSVFKLLRRGETRNDLRPVAIYLNRLSDLLFVLARKANQAMGGGESRWAVEDFSV